MTAASPRRFGAVLFWGAFALFLLFGATPIRSYDYFWHLATGRWIAAHNALPFSDPFAVASDRIEWINGSWLFQWMAHAIYSIGDHVAVNFTRMIAVAVTFGFIAMRLARSMHPMLALAATSLAYAGAAHRLGTRPETAGVICCVVALILLLRDRDDWWEVAAYTAVVALWANLHPSALLGPLMSAIAAAAALTTQRERPQRVAVIRTVLALAALLATPHGWKGVIAPLQLASQVGAETFVNLEWLPTSPRVFPLFYVAVIVAGSMLLLSRQREWRRIILFTFFAILAARYVRNHGFFYATLPLLIAPELARLSRGVSATRVAALAAAVVIVIATSLVRLPLALGVDPELFPHRTVATLKALPLQGAIYNPDQFGGFIIWNTYPPRRALTDGRNELHKSYLETFATARNDSRRWNAFLEKFEVESAVEEYRSQPLQVIDPTTRRARNASPSLAFFPRREWALIDFDDVSMLFIRRSGLDAATLEKLEYRQLRPDLTSREEIADPQRFILEFNRASSGGAGPRRLQELAARLRI
jgi:hypothetical protein